MVAMARAHRDVLPAGGPEATDRALARAAQARAVLLVEGYSDQIAVETLAARQGLDLARDGVLVLPIGGAQAVVRFLERFAGVRVGGLCDVGEEEVFRRGLERAGHGAKLTRSEMEQLGFFVCVVDLEDELIRALGPASVEAVVDAQGDLGSFRTLQKQPAWRGQPLAEQLRRFMGSGGRRKLHYAMLLVEALPLDQVPRPLTGVLAAIR
jgi:hypothetical protein